MTRSQGTEDRQTQRCLASFDGKGGSSLLVQLAEDLLARQRKNWPALIDGYAALSAARTRRIDGDGWSVRVQFNPRRIVSSGAKLDPESIRRRPCFLCLENLPPEQQAIRYRDDFLILCNPAPISGHPLPGRFPHPLQPGAHFPGPLDNQQYPSLAAVPFGSTRNFSETRGGFRPPDDRLLQWAASRRLGPGSPPFSGGPSRADAGGAGNSRSGKAD